MEGMLHLKVLRSPHAHARIVSIDKSAALAVPGVHAVFTWEDVPRKLYTTAIHDDYRVDPNDTYMLDNVVRFVGQRVAAVVADTEAAAEEGLPPDRGRLRGAAGGLRPRGGDAARRAGVHDKGAGRLIRNPERNILIDLHGGVGDVEAGFAEADVIHEGTYSTHRGQHAHLETHCSIAWIDEDERLQRAHQLAVAIHLPRQALLPLRPLSASMSASSASASAAASAASRKCSPRT